MLLTLALLLLLTWTSDCFLHGFARFGHQMIQTEVIQASLPRVMRTFRIPCSTTNGDYDGAAGLETETEIDDILLNSSPPESFRDPVAKAIADREAALKEEVQNLESVLRAERTKLAKLRDRISESGKTGFFIVQAQVNDFARKKEAEQKARVTRNKKEFVEKMLPWVDAFRSAPTRVPAATEKGMTMHKSFSSLLDSVLAVFGKYGYKEFAPVPGEKLNAQLHQITEVRDVTQHHMLDDGANMSDVSWSAAWEEETGAESSAGEVPGQVGAGGGAKRYHPELEDGVILEVVRPGMRDAEDGVLRKAQVVVSGKPTPVGAPEAAIPAPEQEVAEAGSAEQAVEDTGGYERDEW